MKPQPQKAATFDSYAKDYASLIHDPIRDKFAAGSRFFFERKIQVIQDFFKRRAIETRGLAWLDIGCGQGDLLRLGREHFKSCAGCDPSEGMLQSCGDLEVRHQQSLETLPYDDATFDFITTVCVYHHVPAERRPVLTAEALRVLKPRGIFCVVEHNPRNPVTRRIVSRTPVDADALLLTANEAGQLLSAASANVLETRYFLLVPERLRLALPFENVLRALPFGGQYAVFANRPV